MPKLDPLTLTLNTSARAASAAPVDEPEPELVPDSEPDSDPELGSALSPLAASDDEAPDEFDEFDAPLAEPSLLGVVVVTGSFREQPENPAKAIKVSESGTHNASARPTAEIRDVETIT